METKIIDNVLPHEKFVTMQNTFMSVDFPWFFTDFMTYGLDIRDKNFYMTHQLYREHIVNSRWFEYVDDLLSILDAKALIRVKANLYPNLGEPVFGEIHTDYDYPHKGALYYINDNNGYTELEDGTRIESVANRLVIFDSAKPHRSVSCTDQTRRVNINFNYF